MSKKKKEDLKKMFSNSEWNSETIIEADKVVSKIAEDYLGLKNLSKSI